MATLNLKILPNRRKLSGKLGIYVSLTFKKEVRYISTEFEVDDEYQFENGKVCYRKDAAIMNKRIQYVLGIYRERMEGLNLNRFSNCAQLKEVLMKDGEEAEVITVRQLFERRIERLEKEKRISYAEMNRYTCKVIVSLIGDIPIDYLTKRDIRETLFKGMQRRGYAKGNIQMRMTHFKAAINEAIDEGLVKYDEHPFKGFTMPQSEPKLMDITVTQFQRIRDMATSDSKLMLARDLFLLSFYLGGINLADLVETDLSSKTMTYVRKKSAEHKTGERTTSLTIPDEAKTIINKYILGNRLNLSFCNGYKNLQRYVNKCFAALAQHIGIQTSFSYYAGRKTFAQFAFMIGIRTEVVEYCIGQSVKKNRPIYNYVRVMQKQADAAVRKVIQYTVDPESFETENIP